MKRVAEALHRLRGFPPVAALEARTVCSGHGRPLRGDEAVERIQSFAADLPVEHPTP